MQDNVCAGHLHKAMASVRLSSIFFNSKWLQQTKCSYCTPYNNCASYVMAQESEKLRGHGGAQKTDVKIWLAGCICSSCTCLPTCYPRTFNDSSMQRQKYNYCDSTDNISEASFFTLCRVVHDRIIFAHPTQVVV